PATNFPGDAREASEDERRVHYPDSAPPDAITYGWTPGDSGGDLTRVTNRARPTCRADFGGKPLPARLPWSRELCTRVLATAPLPEISAYHVAIKAPLIEQSRRPETVSLRADQKDSCFPDATERRLRIACLVAPPLRSCRPAGRGQRRAVRRPAARSP